MWPANIVGCLRVVFRILNDQKLSFIHLFRCTLNISCEVLLFVALTTIAVAVAGTTQPMQWCFVYLIVYFVVMLQTPLPPPHLFLHSLTNGITLDVDVVTLRRVKGDSFKTGQYVKCRDSGELQVHNCCSSNSLQSTFYTLTMTLTLWCHSSLCGDTVGWCCRQERICSLFVFG